MRRVCQPQNKGLRAIGYERGYWSAEGKVFESNKRPWRKLDVGEMRARLKQDPDFAAVDMSNLFEMSGKANEHVTPVPVLGLGCDSHMLNPTSRGIWPGRSGLTLLHEAAARGHACCVRMLLGVGCRQVANEVGETPLDFALAKARNDKDYPDTDEGKLLRRAAWECVVALGGEIDREDGGASEEELAQKESARLEKRAKHLEEEAQARRFDHPVTEAEVNERYRAQYGQPKGRDDSDLYDNTGRHGEYSGYFGDHTRHYHFGAHSGDIGQSISLDKLGRTRRADLGNAGAHGGSASILDTRNGADGGGMGATTHRTTMSEVR